MLLTVLTLQIRFFLGVRILAEFVGAVPVTESPTNAPEPTEIPTEAIEPTIIPTENPTEPLIKGNTYYLTGSIAGWGLDARYELVPTVNSNEFMIEHITLTTNDMVKVIKSDKYGREIAGWYPDGMENNRTVDYDSTYTILFRPYGDGDDTWEYIPYAGDGTGLDYHFCTIGGYMFKIIDENAPEPTISPETDAPTEEPPTEPLTEEPQPTTPPETEPPTDAPEPTAPPETEAPTEEPEPTQPIETEAPPTEPEPTTPPETEAPTEPMHDPILGDVDSDGVVSVMDATRIQRYLAYLCSLDGGEYRVISNDDTRFQFCDVDGDGRISIFDALRIQRYIAKMCKLDGSPFTA